MENKNFYRIAYRYDFKEIKYSDYYKDIFYKNQILACLSITLKFKLISEKENQEILFDFIEEDPIIGYKKIEKIADNSKKFFYLEPRYIKDFVEIKIKNQRLFIEIKQEELRKELGFSLRYETKKYSKDKLDKNGIDDWLRTVERIKISKTEFDEILKEINENNYEVELRNVEKVKSIIEK